MAFLVIFGGNLTFIYYISSMEGCLTTRNPAGSDSMGASQQELDRVLHGDYRNAFRAQDYFSVDDNSIAHVFDVMQGNGIMKNNLGGDTLLEMMKVSYLSALFHFSSQL